MALDVDTVSSSSDARFSGRGRLPLLLALVVLLAFGAYLLGSHRTSTRVVTGPAQAGDRVVTMTVDGTSYGFAESMPWISVDGSYHEGGWPACLGSTTTVPAVTFGITRVDYPDGAYADQVVYVDCRTGPGTFG